MSKVPLLLLCLLFCLARQQTLSPLLLLPTETTQNVSVDYAFKLYTDTNVPHSASIALTFPFEYDPRELIKYTGCYFSNGTAPLQQRPCSVSLRTFTVNVGQIQAGSLTIFIKNIKNPVEASMSSHFSMKTSFRDVTITENLQFGKLPFTKPSSKSIFILSHQNIHWSCIQLREQFGGARIYLGVQVYTHWFIRLKFNNQICISRGFQLK